MRWQRVAQALIAIFVVGFIAILVTSLRKQTARPQDQPPPADRIDREAVVENPGGCEQITAAAGKRVFSIKCGKHFLFKDGRQRMTDGVEVTINRSDREFVIKSAEADITPKDDKIDRAVFKGDVRFTGQGGLEVKAAEATYSDNDGILNIPGPVEFTKGRMRGSGVGATYDRTREVLWLKEKAQFTVEANPKTGQGGVQGTAGSIGLARADHYVRFLQNANLTGEGRVLQADDLVVRLAADDERVQAMELRGNSRITGGSGGPQAMSARDIDLTYAEDGRTLQNARLTENAVVQLAGAAQGKRISGSTMDITLGPDGSSVTNLTASAPVQVDLPAEGQSPAKRIRSANLAAHGAPGQGLQSATFTGAVEYRETRPAAPRQKLAALDRTARADTLIVETKPGLGAMERADFRGNFTFTEAPDLSAEAPQAIYHVARDRIELMPGEGLPGPAPRVTDRRIAVSARTIAFSTTTREMNAETKVRSTMQPQKNREANAGGKLPSMLKQDQPVNVTANRLAYKGTGAAAIYSGAAMMWQGDETTIKGDTITIDDRNGNLRADGKVTTFFNIDEAKAEGSAKKRTPTTGTAETFTYDDARRLATYSGKAHIVGPQGDVTGQKIALFLKKEESQLERAEAYGPPVVVKEGSRMGTGTHLTYTAADDKYLLIGTPVEIIEERKGTCTRMIGTAATFNRTTEATRLDGSPHFPSETKTLPSCPPALKR